MLGLMGFSGSLPLYVIHRYYIFVFIDRANKDACLLVLRHNFSLLNTVHFACLQNPSTLSLAYNHQEENLVCKKSVLRSNCQAQLILEEQAVK